MTQTLHIRHVTTYAYDEPVYYGLQQLRLTPKGRAGQHVIDWKTTVTGGRIEVAFDDSHANRVQLVSLQEGAERVEIVAEGTVEISDETGVIGAQGGYMPLWMFLRPTDLTRRGSATQAFAREVRGIDDQLEQMHALSQVVREAVAYDTGGMDVARTAEEAASQGHGVCQDHAHIFCTAARLLDRPARYVSGYLKMNDREHQEATHAWAEAYIDGLGWVGFDVSNGYSPDTRYCRVATGLDYTDAAPISGIRQGAGTETMKVELRVAQADQLQSQSQAQQSQS
ncbi:transglutaminase family protein [Jannaschia seohaensis]|uniref:Transglutaminase-like enzyme, putative cysteine protease n=1 Tax=Jannaschia seohaensis TaxID=475081 RepID=A0A2Y9A7S8_9RHOB|nr:transglutaminase family protein [Jannaschia seohaensis]PWJ22321.1 transglutaminase-like putative cysteine protease [Jannaschia seohaensis]SSA38599.1 Transglutaminase-like enzyme, putative cysteine protease [Jannaschia seohaensis]